MQAIIIKTLMIMTFETSEYVSKKSTPSTCWQIIKRSVALNLSIDPSVLTFFS